MTGVASDTTFAGDENVSFTAPAQQNDTLSSLFRTKYVQVLPNVTPAYLSQFSPITPGRQTHWPVSWSQLIPMAWLVTHLHGWQPADVKFQNP